MKKKNFSMDFGDVEKLINDKNYLTRGKFQLTSGPETVKWMVI